MTDFLDSLCRAGYKIMVFKRKLHEIMEFFKCAGNGVPNK